MKSNKKKRAVKKRVSKSKGKKLPREKVIDRRKSFFSIKGKPANQFIRRKRRAGKYKGKTPHVYDIYFPGSPKSMQDIDNAISLDVQPLKELPRIVGNVPRYRVKLTVISRYVKKRSAVTYIYEVDEPFEVNLAILDILYEIYLSPKRGQKGYLQKVRSGNVEQIVVDFETSV